MNLRLCTDNSEFYSDLCDVLRLFYGDVTVADVSGTSPEPAGDLFAHSATRAGEVWIDRWSHADARQELRTAVCHGHPLEVKRLRKRAVKLCLYNLCLLYTSRWCACTSSAWNPFASLRSR